MTSNHEPTADQLHVVGSGEPDPLKGGDVYRWAMDQAALIKAHRLDAIDWTNVADEIETLGRSEIDALRSDLTVIIQHMLKWDYQPSRRSRSWECSIREHRRRVMRRLNESPSLKSKMDTARMDAFDDGRDRALAETGLAKTQLPMEMPYDWDAVMTRSFVLDQTDEAS